MNGEIKLRIIYAAELLRAAADCDVAVGSETTKPRTLQMVVVAKKERTASWCRVCTVHRCCAAAAAPKQATC